MTNASSGNSILVYSRSSSGALTQIQEISTQGLGSGGTDDPLGSQGALTLSSDGQLLLAVNAGSNQVTSFRVTSAGLQFASIVPSGGTFPVSVAIYRGRAFVLNQAGTANVTAFQISGTGVLTPLSGMRLVPGGAAAGAAQIGVTPDGKVLIVTEKETSYIDLFPLTGGHVNSVPSDGPGPFGFTFGLGSSMIVAEAPNSTISSYGVVEGTTPTLRTITNSLHDTGGTACWIVTSPDGQYVYVVNSMSRTISTLGASQSGGLHLIAADAANMGTANGPIDLAITHDGAYLYILSSTTGLVVEFAVNGGRLTQIGTVSGIPVSLQGIAAW